MATNTEQDPLSPDRPGWGANYTPSNDTPNGWVAVVGRRRARIMHGQDPQQHPEMFTPQVDLTKFKWPTNEEAEQWVDHLFKKSKKPKKLEQELEPSATPAVGAAANCTTAVTEEKAAEAYAGPVVPIQMDQ